MPKTSEATTTSTARRRSSRTQSVTSKAKALETSKVLEMNDDEIRMPAGYNPSDDSEEEYVPPTNDRRSRVLRKRKAASEEISSDEEKAPTPVKRSRNQTTSTPGRSSKKPPTEVAVPAAKKTSSILAKASTPYRTAKNNKPDPKNNNNVLKVKNEPGSGLIDSNNCYCPFPNCEQKLKISENCRFHIAMHYYDQNKFSTMDILKPEDPDMNGRAIDEKGKKYKYTCEYRDCTTKRKMGHKEMCVHLATHHQQLKKMMESDSSPEIKQLLSVLYPSEVKSPAKVKKEKYAEKTLLEENDNSEEEDDPTAKPPTKPQMASSSARQQKTYSTNVPQTTQPSTISSISRPKVDKMMNCFLCKEKEGKNLNTGTTELKYHISVCAYLTGGFLKYLPHGQACGKDAQLSDKSIEEYGSKYKYKCPFDNCDKGKPKAKPTGYKELSIHSGSMHGILERWAQDSNKEGAKELYELLKSQREEEGKALEEVPNIPFEEVHTCCICDGQDKEGKNLSLSKEKIYQTRYHYAACIYDSGFYLDMYPPGRQNVTEDGKPRDVLGKEVKYSCQEKGCKMKRKMGYKEFCIHMSNDHGGLEEVLTRYDSDKIREIAPKLNIERR